MDVKTTQRTWVQLMGLALAGVASVLLMAGCKPGMPANAVRSPALAFDITGTDHFRPETNCHSSPAVILEFSHPVAAENLTRYFEFRDRSGKRRAATVRQLVEWERPGRWSLGLPESFGSVPIPPELSPSYSEPGAPTNPVPNYILVTAATPLPVGKEWVLTVAARLPSTEAGLSMRHSREIPLGDVAPFAFVSAESEHVVNQSPSVSLLFSKRVSTEVTNSLGRWLQVEPVVKDLSLAPQGDTLVLRGPFKSGQRYTIILEPSFAAEEPFTLGSTRRIECNIPKVEPRLYFPAFSIDQYAGGIRSFPFLAVNVPQTLVRAKRVDTANLVHALRGFDGYVRPWRNGFSSEPFRQLEYNLVPGRTVFTRQLETSPELDDVARTFTLSWDEILGAGRTGLVLLDAQRTESGEPPLGTQALVQVTDLGVLWKQSYTTDRLWAAVFSYRTGRLIPGAQVRLLSEESEFLASGETDAQGVVQLVGGTNSAWLVAEADGDTHALKLMGHPLNHWSADYPTGDENPGGRRILLFTDRQLYRPGETLHLKAIARDFVSEEGLVVPEPFTAALSLWDPRNRKLLEANLTFSALGSASASLGFDAPSRGQYHLRLEVADQQYYSMFRVEEFKPNAFEVGLRVLPGFETNNTAGALVSGRYFFGKPLSQAKVTWSLTGSDMTFCPTGFEGFQFARRDVQTCGSEGNRFLASGVTNLLNSDVLLSTEFCPIDSRNPQPSQYWWSVGITDLNQQTVWASESFSRHASDFYLGLRPQSGVVQAGENLEIELVAVGADGVMWPEPVTTELMIRKVDWRSSRIEGAGGALRYLNEPVLTEVTNLTVELPGNGKTDAKFLKCRLAMREAGQYVAEAVSRDNQQRLVAASATFYVSEQGNLAWNYRNEVQLNVKADREKYHPGETARLLVEAPFSGTAIVSIERERVLRSFSTQLDGNAPSIEIPLETNDLPNVFVTVTLVRGADDSPYAAAEPAFRFGTCMLSLESLANHLDVEVQTSAPTYQPGRLIDLSVQVKDASGNPAPDAEVTVYAVDEGVASLADDAVPDPLEFFYAPRPLSVHSSISLPNLLTENPTELRFHNKGYLGGDGGRDSRVRKAFLACAFWRDGLRTDSSGMVRATFTAPDSLTRYRLVAIVCHSAERFGSARTAFRIEKPLSIEPALPRFACATDQFLARALVHNQTKKDGMIQVNLQLDSRSAHIPSLAFVESARVGELGHRTLNVPAGGTVSIDFPVRLVSAGQAQWTWRASFEDEAAGVSDAVESTIDIGYPTPLLRQVVSRAVVGTAPSAAEPVSLLSGVDPALLSCASTVVVHLASSRLGDMSESIARLLKYPYGCAEQTCSSLLPWLVLSPSFLGVESARLFPLPASSSAPVRAGLRRLVSMQTENGGLGYWPGDNEPSPFASAYAGVAFGLAQRSGVFVPETEYTNLLAYLSRSLRDSRISVVDHSLALFALALGNQAEPAYHEQLFSIRAKLTVEQRALLALAILEAKGPAEMAATLLQNERQSGRVVHEDWFGGPARSIAIQLMAWLRLISVESERNDHALTQVDRFVTDLVRERQDGHWQTTQGNAWALFALAEYARHTGATDAAIQGELVSQTGAVSFDFRRRADTLNQTFVVDQLTSSKTFRAALKLTQGGPVYATVTVEGRPPTNAVGAIDEGFSIRRSYHGLNDKNELQPPSELKVGDRVLVRLEIGTREPARYVALEDRLPANLEVIRPEFKTSGAERAEKEMVPSRLVTWNSDYKEVRGDQVMFFSNYLAPGAYRLQYLARVTAAAQATAPAAKIEEMYHPERRGLSAAMQLNTAPLSGH